MDRLACLPEGEHEWQKKNSSRMCLILSHKNLGKFTEIEGGVFKTDKKNDLSSKPHHLLVELIATRQC